MIDEKKKGTVFSDFDHNTFQRQEYPTYVYKKYTECRLANQLENAIRQFVKEKLDLIMREEIKNFLEFEQAGTPNMRNGYYQRNLDTQYGRIQGLLVPRDRNGEFQTQLFAPCQRHTGWLEEAII